MDDVLQVQREERVAWLTINRPEVHNALSTATNLRLVETLSDLDQDKDIGCIVLCGAGERAFSVGADLREVTGKSAEELRTEFRSIVASIEAMRSLGKPVIAAVQGYALGGGLGLVAAADMAIASEAAVFGTPEITIGRFPLIISAPILRAVKQKKVFEMAFSGHHFDAMEAHEMGLVNRVVGPDDLWSQTRNLAHRVAAFSPDVLRLGKKALYNASDMEFHQSLEYLSDALTINALMKDSEEGVHAFLEKEPQWRTQ